MHMMFVDESGDPGYPKDGNWGNWSASKSFVRVGLVIHGWKWKAWHQRLVSFKFNRGLMRDSEIKASHLRLGKGAFVGWDEPRRHLFLADLAKLIGLNPEITLLAVAIDKTRIDTDRKSVV